MKALSRGQRGFTLVEMMIVMAILAVMAAVVFPSVTGTTTASRSTSQSTDLNSVATAVERFNADDDDGSPWPTLVNLTLPAAGTAWTAGKLPTGTVTGTGTSADPYVFTQADIAGIDWVSDATVDGASKDFYPDYLKNKPNHTASTDTITLNKIGGAANTSSKFKIKKSGSDVYVQLKNSTLAADGVDVIFTLWGIDKNGSVWVFVEGTSY